MPEGHHISSWLWKLRVYHRQGEADSAGKLQESWVPRLIFQPQPRGVHVPPVATPPSPSVFVWVDWASHVVITRCGGLGKVAERVHAAPPVGTESETNLSLSRGKEVFIAFFFFVMQMDD